MSNYIARLHQENRQPQIIMRVTIQPQFIETSIPAWVQNLIPNKEASTMQTFSDEMATFWQQVENGEFQFSKQELALADKLQELFPNHLLK